MGCTLTSEEKEAAARSKTIDRYLVDDGWKFLHEVGILLVGNEESGKSTFRKQMKILHGEGYSEEERRHYKVAVYRDIIKPIVTIIRRMEHQGIGFEDVARAGEARQLLELAQNVEDGVMSEDLAGVIRRLWEDAGVQFYFSRSPEHQLSDTTSYYLHNLDRICRADYIPTEQDVLRVRSQLLITGYERTRFIFKDRYFTIAAAQDRTLLRYCDINAIILCVSLSDYDIVLYGYEQQMEANIALFKQICNMSHYRYKDIVMVIIFTKIDLFAQKISRIPLSTCFPEYSGPNTYEEAAAYIREQFEAVYRFNCPDHLGKLSTHFTCTTDTESVESVFNAAADLMIKHCSKARNL